MAVIVFLNSTQRDLINFTLPRISRYFAMPSNFIQYFSFQLDADLLDRFGTLALLQLLLAIIYCVKLQQIIVVIRPYAIVQNCIEGLSH